MQGWQAEKQRAAELERQLSFFQASSATAIADRDSAVYEAQTYRAELEVRPSVQLSCACTDAMSCLPDRTLLDDSRASGLCALVRRGARQWKTSKAQEVRCMIQLHVGYMQEENGRHHGPSCIKL
jgi:hypothetical protein